MKKQIPNLITLANLFCGMMATYHAFYGRFEYAAMFIFLGIFFDFFDGMAARLLNVSSEFGKELDSLADVVTSGVAPGSILFNILWNHETSTIIKYVAFLIPVFAAYRLAKFNLDERQYTSFRGLPAPANALIWAGIGIWCANTEVVPYPVWLDTAWIPTGDGSYLSIMGCTEYMNTSTALVIIALLSVVTDFLLIADFKMFSLKVNFKDLSWKTNGTRYIFLAVCALLVIGLGSLSLPILILWYIIWSLCTQKEVEGHE